MAKGNLLPPTAPQGAKEEVIYVVTTADRDDQHPPTPTEIDMMVALCRKLLPHFASAIVAGFGVRHELLAKKLWTKLMIGMQIRPNEAFGEAGEPAIARAWSKNKEIFDGLKAGLPDLCVAVTDMQVMRVIGAEAKEAFPYAIYEVHRQNLGIRGYRMLGRLVLEPPASNTVH